jgi:type VI secretion system protein ImpC
MVASYRVMPLLSIRGRPEVRLGGFSSLVGSPLAGFWAPADAKAPVGASPGAAAPAPEAAAEPVWPPVDTPAGPAPAEDAGMSDLDKMLAGLSAPAEAAAEEAPAEAPAEDEAMSDLDKLLASLNAPAEPVAEDATEPDLDALLASLK